MKDYHSSITHADVKKASGVSVCVRINCQVKPMEIAYCTENVTLLVSTKHNGKFFVSCFYNLPSSSQQVLLEDIDVLLTKLNEKYLPVFVIRDMNLYLSKEETFKDRIWTFSTG